MAVSGPSTRGPASTVWPALPFMEWRDTLATLHRYTQVVGKVRLALAPMMNHFWQVVLYVTPRGLTTSPIPFERGTFQVDFDFLDHELLVSTHSGERRVLALEPRPVADFYRDVMATLRGLGIDVRINEAPREIPDDVTPFGQDRHHASYDREAVERWHQAMVQADTELKAFRASFTGKCSPVHFFWGGFDLAVTRFSGRRAPPREGADRVTQESYSEEVSSLGFWPGSEQLGGPAFYSYAAPEPAGYSEARVGPEEAYYDSTLKLFLLPYDVVRSADEPGRVLHEFFQSTYEAAANLGRWDRARLERPFLAYPPRQPEPRTEVLPEPLGAH
ncbi:DUF5996 family protein [Archangium violaceum]|uniref:DUF5996 family protein n=1 Tax=Archangium violaceum TaxID=83451 RepID=UPI002B298403|nr:DUF5996 family protein [Archangium gephyra]